MSPQASLLILARLGPASAKDKRRLLFRTLLHPITMSGWLAELHRISERSLAEIVPFDLARKPTSKFLHNGLRPAQRATLLASHYELLFSALGSCCVRDLITGRDLVFSMLTGRSGHSYQLRLNRANGREGELAITLVRVDDQIAIATVTFAIGASRQGQPIGLWIGGLQGCANQLGKLLTIQTTRDLFGLRPKDLLMHAVYALKERLGASEVKAVSNHGHTSSRTYRPKKWSANYNLYWADLGGQAIHSYAYQLPLDLRKRSINEVAPAKRSTWRARHALIDQIIADVAKFGPERSTVKHRGPSSHVAISGPIDFWQSGPGADLPPEFLGVVEGERQDHPPAGQTTPTPTTEYSCE